MHDNGSQSKAQLENKYARDEPEVTTAGATESCGWNSCNTQIEDPV